SRRRKDSRFASLATELISEPVTVGEGSQTGRGDQPSAFREADVEQVADVELNRAPSVGLGGNRLVEHHRQRNPRAQFGESAELLVRYGLFDAREIVRVERAQTL